MSSSVVGPVRESAQDVNVSGQLDGNQVNRNPRSERSGKGRRRRAAADQRRIDQQRWGQYITDEEDECATGMAPRSGNRRRARRNNRNNPNSSHHLEDYYQDELAFRSNQPRNENCDDFDLEMALSLSLSLADPPPYSGGIEYSNQGTVDMSYEVEPAMVSFRFVQSCSAPKRTLVCFDPNIRFSCARRSLVFSQQIGPPLFSNPPTQLILSLQFQKGRVAP